MTRVTIRFDPNYDLLCLGLDPKQAELIEFAAAYRQAAERIAAQLGVELILAEAPYDSTADRLTTETFLPDSPVSIEQQIWYQAHAAVHRDSHGHWLDTES